MATFLLMWGCGCVLCNNLTPFISIHSAAAAAHKTLLIIEMAGCTIYLLRSFKASPLSLHSCMSHLYIINNPAVGIRSLGPQTPSPHGWNAPHTYPAEIISLCFFFLSSQLSLFYSPKKYTFNLRSVVWYICKNISLVSCTKYCTQIEKGRRPKWMTENRCFTFPWRTIDMSFFKASA